MKLKKNKSLPEKKDKNDTINETLKPLRKKGCNGIGKKWKRICPKCKKRFFIVPNIL